MEERCTGVGGVRLKAGRRRFRRSDLKLGN